MVGIVGASGLIGYNLYKYLKDKDVAVLGTYCSLKKQGLHRFNLVEDSFSIFDSCQQVIIAAGITNIDECFLQRQRAYDVNVAKTIKFIQYLSDKKIKAIFLSSDQVFGDSKGNYREEDIPHPINCYGRFKLQAEQFMQQHSEDYLILRLSKIYSRNLADRGIFREIFYKLKNAERIKAADNQIYNPTDVAIVSKCIYQALQHRNLKGLYHLAEPAVMSRYDFARRVAEECGFEQALIEPIDFRSLSTIEKRGLDTSLNVEKINKMLDLT